MNNDVAQINALYHGTDIGGFDLELNQWRRQGFGVGGGKDSGSGGRNSPSGVQWQSPGMGSGGRVSQKLKRFCKLMH